MDKTILIIENDEAFRIAIEDALVDEGWHVLTAPSGEEGLKTIEQQRPDLILLDILLTGISGLDVLQQLRADKEWGQNVPIIVMTGLTYLENLQEIKERASDFIYKENFKVADLVNIIKQHLNEATTPTAETEH